MVNAVSLYHMTAIDNLHGIAQRGLLCDRQAQHLTRCSIAYPHLKQRRQVVRVPVEPYGVVADYVPFYFAPRSPMLYAIHTGYVHGAPPQSQIIYLVTTVQVVQAHGLPCVFTDRHPVTSAARFFNDLNLLETEIDWEVMRSSVWMDTAEYPDRKSRRQAEFLVYQQVPWGCIREIGVYDNAVRQRVLTLLQSLSHQPRVAVCRGWYY